MHQALYRKYRPQTFDDVCGQEHITSVLKYETASGKTSHAYLFCGSRGTGKTTCAKILAKAINCENPVNGNPCGVCSSCRDIDAGAATDVLEMDAASNNGVDYIREIRDEVVFTPAMLKKRVYIIDEVHMLSTSAFNALLKTLEEPPEHVVFILATTELHKLPATIISRCQRFDFRRISLPVIADRLAHIAENEGITLEDDAALMIGKQAQGGMRDAISLFELCSGGGSAVTTDRVASILGLSGYEQMHDTVMSIAKGDMASLFATVADVVASSKDITVFLSELISFYRDMLVTKYVRDNASYLDLTAAEKQLLDDASSKLGLQTIIYHCDVLDNAMQSVLRSPSSKRTELEFALMRMCDPKLDTSDKSLAARIEALEDKIARLSFAPRAVSDELPSADDVPSVETPAEVPASSAPADQPEEKQPSAAVYEQIFDITEVTDRLGRVNQGIASFLTSAEIGISPDRKKVSVRLTDSFAHMMLSQADKKKDIADAFALSGVTDGTPDVVISLVNSKNNASSASDDLFDSN